MDSFRSRADDGLRISARSQRERSEGGGIGRGATDECAGLSLIPNSDRRSEIAAGSQVAVWAMRECDISSLSFLLYLRLPRIPFSVFLPLDDLSVLVLARLSLSVYSLFYPSPLRVLGLVPDWLCVYILSSTLWPAETAVIDASDLTFTREHRRYLPQHF